MMKSNWGDEQTWQHGMNTNSSWEDRRNLISHVAKDFSNISEYQSDRIDQFKLRMTVRTLFSLVDSFCWYLKCEALRAAKNSGVEFSTKVLQVLTETRIHKGEEIKYYPSPKENLKCSIKAFSRVREGKQVPDCLSRMPTELDVAIVVRNRITHPKTVEEYDITSLEWGAIQTTMHWLLELFDWQKEQDLFWIEETRKAVNETFKASREKIRADCPDPDEKDSRVKLKESGGMHLPPHPRKEK